MGSFLASFRHTGEKEITWCVQLRHLKQAPTFYLGAFPYYWVLKILLSLQQHHPNEGSQIHIGRQ
jgi:hypothetical protein